MTRKEHLLTITTEECNETAQRISKILRFGFSEVEPGQKYTNEQRFMYEFSQLYGMVEMLTEEGYLKESLKQSVIEQKKKTVEKYLELSKQQGTLTQE